MPLSLTPTADLRAELARREALRRPADNITILSASLVRKAAKFYGIEPALVIGKGQTNFAANCRWAVWEALRQYGFTSQTEIGEVFGRHCSAVSNCWEKIASRKLEDTKLSECIDHLNSCKSKQNAA